MIRIDHLNFHYKKQKPLFSDLELDVPKGSICGLLGKNGAGKTTLLKLMTGLTYPKSGQLTINGYQPSDRHPDFLADLFIVPEEFHVPDMKIATYEKVYSNFYPNFSAEQFNNNLRAFELEKDNKLNGLSYGQKKKTILSFAMATNSKLLILDEPTNGLDIPSKSTFRKRLAASIDDDKCFLISTHQVKDISNLIDPVVILEQGKVILNSSIDKITARLHFGLYPKADDVQDCLFSERMPGGYYAVMPNITGEETEIDLELLFNAVISNKQRIAELFGKEVSHEE